MLQNASRAAAGPVQGLHRERDLRTNPPPPSVARVTATRPTVAHHLAPRVNGIPPTLPHKPPPPPLKHKSTNPRKPLHPPSPPHRLRRRLLRPLNNPNPLPGPLLTNQKTNLTPPIPQLLHPLHQHLPQIPIRIIPPPPAPRLHPPPAHPPPHPPRRPEHKIL